MKTLDNIGYKGYKVDEYGNIYSKRTGKKMKPHTANDGVLKIELIHTSGKRKQESVHRLIAKAFIPNPDNKPQVDHIDGNKQNNNASNLRWCTNIENQEFREEQCNTGKEQQNKKIKWGDTVYLSIYSLARKIAEMRGSKVETVRKEIKAVRYGPKTLYGKYCQIV